MCAITISECRIFGVRGQLAENDDAGFSQHSGCPPSVTVLEQEVSTVEVFVYLGALIHSPSHSFSDIMRQSAFTRTAMQRLDKQLWWSRILLSTKLRLYNTCILPIFLYGSDNGRQCRCKADLDFLAFCVLEETTRMTVDDLDEDGAERPRFPRAVI